MTRDIETRRRQTRTKALTDNRQLLFGRPATPALSSAGENLDTGRTSARTTDFMSALNRVDQIRHHRIHADSRSYTGANQPDVTTATLTSQRASHPLALAWSDQESLETAPCHLTPGMEAIRRRQLPNRACNHVHAPADRPDLGLLRGGADHAGPCCHGDPALCRRMIGTAALHCGAGYFRSVCLMTGRLAPSATRSMNSSGGRG